MPIGTTEEHLALHEAVGGWLERQGVAGVLRASLDAEHDTLPPYWGGLAEQGWLGLHVAEDVGGSGFAIPELVVVLEELGRALAPGPMLPTMLAAAVVASSSNEGTRKELLPGLASGELVGVVAGGAGCGLSATKTDDGIVVAGIARPVLGGALADVVIAPASLGDGVRWVALRADELTLTELPSLDPTRRVAELVADDVWVPAVRILDGVDAERVVDLSCTFGAAELVGVAQWCVDTAATYAKDRVQFGRPIGQFQGVKHKCADMIARVELARAAAWDAARAVDDDPRERALACATAIALAIDAAFVNAKDCIQVLGGIGFTWEHDAHAYLRRAMTLQSLLGPSSGWRQTACRLGLAGVRRALSVDLGAEADAVRAEVRAFLDEVKDLSSDQQHRRVADAGYIVPTWPEPFGRGAKALEQVVIEEEFRAAKVARPGIMVGGWALPPVIMYGTREQQERWIPPTLRGEISWCQLFSEPGAGSDLASLSTRATRVEGGWMVNGQKVWTSMAQMADWGILLARTNPDAEKHDGISCFFIDMKHTEGLTIRPLRELTGDAMFNEVFFDDAFIPDDCLIGVEHDGWRAARTTLANERVFMGGGMSFGHGLEQILKAIDARGLGDDPLVLDEVGGLVARAHALSCLGYRLTLAALAGADPSGSEASVRKLLGVEHDQHVQEVGLGLMGVDGAIAEGEGERWGRGFLFNRNLTIAGGTSEIQRNIIGERVLGLPRDP
ncbi:MAG TPA: acyl-CoA dehydrogenase [Acidimicrobiia bacterium]|nr:acyl-CoA dehydrogenase [Acidimicrobiia bacterium]